MGLVAADLLEPAAVLAAELHEEATVALAQMHADDFHSTPRSVTIPAVIAVSAANSIF